MTHAVARLRAERLAKSVRPFRARGSRLERCAACRLAETSCICAARPRVRTKAGFCLLMHDIEPLKPTNTGWLVADVVPDTEAFLWARTETDPRLVTLLADPRWTPYVVYPEASAEPSRVVRDVRPAPGRRPLFVLLDGTWAGASRMFRRSPCLDPLPVLSFPPADVSRYRLRTMRHGPRLCTAEAAALCLEAAGETAAARALDAWLELFIARTLDVRRGGPAPAAS